MRFGEAPAPTAMPQICAALLRITDARKALERGEQAWNATQLEDAIRSAEFFIQAARDLLGPAANVPDIPMPSPARL